MLADEANQQKQKKREEQLRRWRERENMEEQNNKNSSSTTSPIDKLQMYRKTSKVRFPKGCVFLAACASGDTDEVKQHLKLGVNINTTNIDGLTALHQACIDANIEIVKFLIDNNADINAQDNEGWTPLHAAVSVGNLEVTKYLIGKGAKLNICNNDSDLPVDLCDSGNTQMRELLEEEMRSQAIDAAFEKQREELLMYEDAKEKNFMDKIHAKTGATPLHVSSAKGYTRVMKLLIQSGANVNAFDNDGWTPLHAAAHWEQEEACKILAESGADFSIKTYSGQTPFDVCDNDMATKLRALQQANSKVSSSTINKSNDSTGTNVTNNSTIPNNNGNSFGKLDARSRRASDEFKSNSIARLTNEAKSSLSEKERKQDKILLSPISNANKPYFDLNYSDIETDTNRTQQHASGHTDVPQSTTTSTSTTTTNNNSLQQQQDKENYSNGSSNTLTSDPTKTPKSGLQETLKSLSAQVKMKIDEDQSDETKTSDNNSTNQLSTSNSSSSINSTNSNTNNNRTHSEKRWGNSTPNEQSTTYKRRALLGNDSTKQTSPPNENGSQESGQTTTTTSTEQSKNDDSMSRRYSSAPIASKDEQAELIRKQKAKLERHFRRSTQAVSYEDIKSAEATIKGSAVQLNSPSLATQTIHENESPTANFMLSSNTTLTSPTSSSSSYFTSPTTTLSAQPTSSTLQGVSSLTSLFGETKRLSTYSTSQPSQQQQQSTSASSNAQPTSQNATNANTTSADQSTTEKDVIIANDIETDKLLNVIEKSKGFSDSNSTTGARRLRNRAFPYSLLNTNASSSLSNSVNENSDENLNSAQNKKINKLIWNEEKQEVEYRGNGSVDLNSPTSNGSQQTVTSPTASSDLNGLSSSSSSTYLRRNNSSGILSSEQTNGEQPLQQRNRPMYRFGQNDGSTTYIQTNNGQTSQSAVLNIPNSLANRSNIKRSVSQVPSSERRPLSASNATLTPTTYMYGTNETSSSSNSNNATNANSTSVDLSAFEQLKRENELLSQTVSKLQKELDEQMKKNSTYDSLDKKEKRAIDRRISELEEEVKKVENLKQDNNRLKEENAALIRVISKLSK